MPLIKTYGKKSGIAEAVGKLLLTENWWSTKFGTTSCELESTKYDLEFSWDTEHHYRSMMYSGALKNKENGRRMTWCYEQPRYWTFQKVVKWIKLNKRNYLFNHVII